MTTELDQITKGAYPVASYDRNQQSFSDLLADGIDEVLGYDLVKDDIADALEGVPFLITHVTFHRGFPSKKTKKLWLSYVSLECLIADDAFLKARRVNMEGKPFAAEQHVVLNDGSTGVQRQIVAFLESKGWIELPEGPADGAMEECRFDAPPSEWIINVGEAKLLEEGFTEYRANIRLLAPRGLRISTYSNDYSQDAKTRYLA